MNVEGNFLRVRRPMLVAEAVCIFAVQGRGEGVVAGGDRSLVDLVRVHRILNL